MARNAVMGLIITTLEKFAMKACGNLTNRMARELFTLQMGKSKSKANLDMAN
jgi:hypothetical protein